MFSFTIYHLLEKPEDFEVNEVSFISEKGEQVILSQHEPLFTNVLPNKIALKIADDKNTIIQIPVDTGGILTINEQNCKVWLF
ncbi:MAG: hypothetical protein LBS83_00650 [Holosporales bacterium]|jgi:F0F1-type ATP synthase epsilon subunit|nr:hypothetical protein [Holosporales bacterium]